MTAAQFRRIASSFPGAVESAHGGHPDFRVRGRIFATLGYPSPRYGMVKVSSADQAFLIRDHPQAFAPAPGKWGESGATVVLLSAAKKDVVAIAIEAAWQQRAAK